MVYKKSLEMVSHYVKVKRGWWWNLMVHWRESCDQTANRIYSSLENALSHQDTRQECSTHPTWAVWEGQSKVIQFPHCSSKVGISCLSLQELKESQMFLWAVSGTMKFYLDLLRCEYSPVKKHKCLWHCNYKTNDIRDLYPYLCYLVMAENNQK